MSITTNGKVGDELKAVLLFAIVTLCLLEYVLRHYGKASTVLSIVEALFTRSDTQWIFFSYITVWCSAFLFLTFSLNNLSLIALLFIAIFEYFIGYAMAWRTTDAVILLAGVTLGKGARVFFSGSGRCESALIEKPGIDQNRLTDAATLLIGLVVLLTFSSWWHLNMAGAYHGPRWMGLWDNPNIYGMLMGAGLTLAIGLLAGMNKEKLRMKKLLLVFLLISAGMMGIGLLLSYSRGAWVGTAVGLLYLAKAHGKLKWRLVLSGILVVVAVVFFFWHSTADTDQWYLKRMDLSRPSAQHRVSAWRGALQIMRDHPFGVGWNKAVGVYEKNYSPPEGGAAALTMNSYLMLGTELGLPGLFCFVGYVALCFRKSSPHPPHPQPLSNPIREGSVSLPAAMSGEGMVMSPVSCHSSLQMACRAGALVLLVTFWFDGGLFTLATASVFWILLELGSISKREDGKQNVVTSQRLIIPAAA